MWFKIHKPNPTAGLRLFCLPYSGAGAAIFAQWGATLPPTVEVCAIQLPGRESRMAEAPFTRMEPLVQVLLPAMRPLLDKPFAIFGHSMGALVGFELARALRREGLPQPGLLAVSGHRAAQLPDTHPPAHGLPEPELIAELQRLNGTPREVLEHPELLQLVLPILRADFAVCEVYHYVEEPPLACPIVAFGGLGDPDVSREELDAWRVQTSASFTLRMLPGDHFFLTSARQLLLQSLARDLASRF
ncbi:MAG: thioesterase domain-containing protein [Chloroflexaceae bacterium]|jgi:medium-chain acyl-[acyl-carrier-protein] hydrolase|nr:thioesterase domain-containing protein [Chloroflexaceae bacterium]